MGVFFQLFTKTSNPRDFTNSQKLNSSRITPIVIAALALNFAALGSFIKPFEAMPKYTGFNTTVMQLVSLELLTKTQNSGTTSIVIGSFDPGCLKVIEAACRYNLLAFVPYKSSPTIGMSSPAECAACTLSWCVRPVIG